MDCIYEFILIEESARYKNDLFCVGTICTLFTFKETRFFLIHIENVWIKFIFLII